MKSRFEPTRKALIFWTMFIGLGAVGGAACMLIDPTGRAMGMDAMLPFFQGLPFAETLFQNFIFSGIALLLVNGLPNLIAAVLLLRRKPAGVVLGGVLGITLMLWICIQFYMFPLNFMSTAYFIFGLLQVLTGYGAWVFHRQEAFAAQMREYRHVGENVRHLVVYFSRMGYVRHVAYEIASRTGAQVYEIKATEPTAGILGFWWCGRFAMHRWAMPIQPVSVDLTAYEHVTLCTPIWAFSLAGPMRTFCRQGAGKVHQVDYALVHHTRGQYARVAAEMDALLGTAHTACYSICCRKGQMQLCTKGKGDDIHGQSASGGFAKGTNPL